MTLATKTKNVSNLALTVCAIRDLIEADELNMTKIQSYGPKIDKFLYDVDRQLKKKGADEYYKIDISSEDLQAIAEASEKKVNQLRPKCTYRSMRKALDKISVEGKILAEPYMKWRDNIPPLFYVCGLLHRLQCVASYQATVLDVLEEEENSNKIENVMMNTLRNAIKKGPDIW